MQALARPKVQVYQYSFAGSITMVFVSCRWILDRPNLASID